MIFMLHLLYITLAFVPGSGRGVCLFLVFFLAMHYEVEACLDRKSLLSYIIHPHLHCLLSMSYRADLSFHRRSLSQDAGCTGVI